MAFHRTKILLDGIEREKLGTDYICPEADREILQELLKKISVQSGTKIQYLAELDALTIQGVGKTVADYIMRFSSESVRGYLIPKLVSTEVADCDKMVLQLYRHFRTTEEYAPGPGKPLPAHIYVRYDNAFKQLKPKRLKADLIALACHPRDVFYLPLTMRMIASWKISEFKDVLISFLDIKQSEDISAFMKREITFTAIEGLKYYPSDETSEIISHFVLESDSDIRAAAKRTLKAFHSLR